MQTIEIPSMKVTKKVKSIQIFKKPVESAVQVFLKRSAQVQYNYSTRIFFLYCSCIALVWISAIQRCSTSFLQLAENLQATCSSCKKLVLQLYGTCADCCNTTKFMLFYCSCIVVVLHLCGPLKTVKISSLLLCSIT